MRSSPRNLSEAKDLVMSELRHGAEHGMTYSMDMMLYDHNDIGRRMIRKAVGELVFGGTITRSESDIISLKPRRRH